MVYIEIIGIVAIALITVFGLSGIVYATTSAEQDDKQVEADDEPIVEGKATIKTNDTDIHITCTSNIPDLVSC